MKASEKARVIWPLLARHETRENRSAEMQSGWPVSGTFLLAYFTQPSSV